MGKSLTSDTKLAISSAPEASYNGMVLVASGFTPLVTGSNVLPVPDSDKSDDRGVIGNQQEGARVQRSGFTQPPTWENSGVVNVGTFAMQARRFFGAADPTPAGADIIEAGVAFRHKIRKLPNNTVAGRQLPSSTWAYINNGLDYVYGGAVGNTLQIQQTAANDPTFTIGYIASGKNRRIRDISGPVFGTLGAPTVQDEMRGAESQLEFNDGTPRQPTSARRLKQITLNVNNVLNSGDRAAGASRNVSTVIGDWILDELLHGDRDQDGAEMIITLDDDMAEFHAAKNNTIITNFTFRMRGYFIPTTAASHQFAVEVIFTNCYFRGTRFNDQNGDACLAITVFPVISDVVYGITIMNVINNNPAAIV